MTNLSIPFGKTTHQFALPDDWDVEILEPRHLPPVDNPREAIEAELRDLNGRYAASALRRRVAVAINDKTRPVPHGLLLPALLDRLLAWGYRREEVTLIIATGAHAPMTSDEFAKVVPDDIADRWTIVSHVAFDDGNMADLGTTSAGTPCRINALFAGADLKIVVGNIEPHQFMGYSGGVKSASIGLASAETIRANHAMLSREGTGPCRYEENPVRQDVEEMGRLIGVDLALNVVLNESKDIVGVFAGDPRSVMERGIALAEDMFVVHVDEPADLVIVSAGGYPKDINLYQAQKAIRHGARVAGEHAPVILAAACSEGVGSERFTSWMDGIADFTEVKRRFATEDFRLGPHKAMLFAADAENRDVYLVSEIPDDSVRRLLLKPAKSIQHVVEDLAAGWIDERGHIGGLGRPPRIVIVPFANATVPTLRYSGV